MSFASARKSYINSGVARGCKNFRVTRVPLKVFGCGRCMDCIRTKISARAGRHVLELANYGGIGVSLGLTFDDAHLSDEQKDPDWWKAEVKRVRARLHYRHGMWVRYWLKAEFGEKNGRQHAHMAIPGLMPPMRPRHGRVDWWPYGIVHQQVYDKSTAYYFADYLGKTEKAALRIFETHSKLYGMAEFHRVVDRQLAVLHGERRRILGEALTEQGLMYDHRVYALDNRQREVARDAGLIRRFDAEDWIARWEDEPNEHGVSTPWAKREAMVEQDLRRASRLRETTVERQTVLQDGVPVDQMIRTARRS